MKTTIIILSIILCGFCFYISDPYTVDAPAQIMCWLCVLSIGMLIANKTPKPYKANESIEYIIANAVKDVAALGMDNNKCKIEIQKLKNDVLNREMNCNRYKKQITELKADLNLANKLLRDLNTPLISETH